MKIPILATLACCALAAPALAAPVEMEDLVARALADSPAARAAQAVVAAQTAREGVVRAQFWPQVTASASLAQTTSVSPALTDPRPFSLGSTSLQARQTLYSFGKVEAEVARAEASTNAAREQAALAAVDVAFGVRQAYLGWLQAAGLEAQAAEQIRFAEATLAEARARFKTGVAARLEVTRADATVAQANASLATARAGTNQARRSLAAAIGRTESVEGEVRFPATPAIAEKPLAQLRAAALEHPDLRTLRARLAGAAAGREAAERAGRPDLNADASYGIRARDFAGVPNWQAGVSASWPLFTGFAVIRGAEAARADEATARETLEARRLTILRDVDNAWLALEGARQAVPAAKTAIDAARANLTQARGRYRAGVGSIIEVADAQSLVASAQADWVRVTTSHHLAIATLQRALGVTGATR